MSDELTSAAAKWLPAVTSTGEGKQGAPSALLPAEAAPCGNAPHGTLVFSNRWGIRAYHVCSRCGRAWIERLSGTMRRVAYSRGEKALPAGNEARVIERTGFG